MSFMYVKWVSDQTEEAQPQQMTNQVAYEAITNASTSDRRSLTGVGAAGGIQTTTSRPLAEYVLSPLNPNQWLSAGASRATRRVLSHALESGVEA